MTLKRKFRILFSHNHKVMYDIEVVALNEFMALTLAAEKAGIGYSCPVVWVTDPQSTIQILCVE
jgi:hypothetical protein